MSILTVRLRTVAVILKPTTPVAQPLPAPTTLNTVSRCLVPADDLSGTTLAFPILVSTQKSMSAITTLPTSTEIILTTSVFSILKPQT